MVVCVCVCVCVCRCMYVSLRLPSPSAQRTLDSITPAFASFRQMHIPHTTLYHFHVTHSHSLTSTSSHAHSLTHTDRAQTLTAVGCCQLSVFELLLLFSTTYICLLYLYYTNACNVYRLSIQPIQDKKT